MRYDRTWPTAVLAIGAGALAGWALMGPNVAHTGRVDQAVEAPQKERSLPERTVGPASRSSAQVAQARMVDRIIAKRNAQLLVEELSHSKHVRERRNAAIRLGTSQEPDRVLGPLTIALRTDRDATVRFMAAEAMGRLGSADAVSPLAVSLVRDPDVRVREAAAGALGVIGHPSVFSSLSDALANDPEADVRVQAARALARIGDERSWAAIAQAQRTDHSEWVRQSLFDLMVGR